MQAECSEPAQCIRTASTPSPSRLRDETIVQLIANTTTAQGLKVRCRLDRRRYPVGRKVTDEELATVRLYPNRFHGDWNYAVRPHR